MTSNYWSCSKLAESNMSTHPSNQALEWAINYLLINDSPILNQKKIIQTPYSEVYKIETTLGKTFYLKQVPEALFLEPMMLAYLHEQELDQLHQLYPLCVKLCADLSEYNLPETINHCDFHENNMLLDQQTGAINIIDWGEVVLTHPFLSLSGCLWNIAYFNKVSQDTLKQLKSQCVSAWLDLYGINDLLYLLNLANQLNGIYAALSYEQMYRATQGKPNSVQIEKKGAIAGCLRTFCKTV